MKVLVVAVHFEVTGARYISDAFSRLGVDVRHIGQAARLKDAWGIDVAPDHEWIPDDNFDKVWADWIPDLIVLADTLVVGYQKPAVYADVPMVYWSNDNHVRNVRRDGIEHYFLAHAHGPAQPVNQPDETWLPCAFDPAVMTRSQIPWDEREYDVCMVGVMYPRRDRIVQMLRASGLKVFAETGLIYDEYQAAYANSRISLCVSAAGDLAQRVFETAAIGCCVLSDKLPDLDNPVGDFVLPGIAFYTTDEICVKVANEIINDKATKQAAQVTAAKLQEIMWAKHKWEDRCQVVLDWYNNRENMGVSVSLDPESVSTIDLGAGLSTNMVAYAPKDKKPYLNLGCGKTHLPGSVPPGHELVDPSIYAYPNWLNVDKVEGVGADKTFDLFRYHWPLEDNSYDGALCAHILEHIPHEIKTYDVATSWVHTDRILELKALQDGWYAFFSELYRVLTNGAIVHIVAPYGWSDGGITDPSHTRYLTANTFTHSMQPSRDGATFQYNNGGINFEVQHISYRPSPMFAHLVPTAGDDAGVAMSKQVAFQNAMQTQVNVCYDFYVQLKVIK